MAKPRLIERFVELAAEHVDFADGHGLNAPGGASGAQPSF
jgi:hypothetical protein